MAIAGLILGCLSLVSIVVVAVALLVIVNSAQHGYY